MFHSPIFTVYDPVLHAQVASPFLHSDEDPRPEYELYPTGHAHSYDSTWHVLLELLVPVQEHDVPTAEQPGEAIALPEQPPPQAYSVIVHVPVDCALE